MADYEPFPTGRDDVDDGWSITRKVLGCLGCGGLGVVGGIVALAFLVGGLASSASGCDIDTSGDPGQGTASQHLPVRVAPASGLDDGSTVRVRSEAFDASSVVGVAVCLHSADTQRRGVQACAEDQGARYATDGRGHLDATYAVPRVITVGGRAYDCAASPRRCLVVAADGNDYDRSGGVPISFRAGLPTAELTVAPKRAATDHLPAGAAPSGPVRAGTQLRILASGFQPGEPLLVARCTDDLGRTGVIASCEPDDPRSAVQAVVFRSLSGEFLRADSKGAVATTVTACAAVAPFGDDVTKALEQYDTPAGQCSPAGADTVDCHQRPGRCAIVVAAAADTKRSAVIPYALAP